MKHLELFEARKKTEDPFYHLAVAIRDYLAENINVKYDPIVKYHYTNIMIYGNPKFDGLRLCEISKHWRDENIFSISIVNLEVVPKRGEQDNRYDKVENNMKDEILKVLNNYPIVEFYDVYKFPKSIVVEMTEDFKMLTSAKKYNL